MPPLHTPAHFVTSGSCHSLCEWHMDPGVTGTLYIVRHRWGWLLGFNFECMRLYMYVWSICLLEFVLKFALARAVLWWKLTVVVPCRENAHSAHWFSSPCVSDSNFQLWIIYVCDWVHSTIIVLILTIGLWLYCSTPLGVRWYNCL